MGQLTERIDQLRARMTEARVDVAAIGVTANMRYLLGFTPFADERLCLLLVDERGARLVVPRVNADQVAAHTGLPLFTWDDAAGPSDALRRALGNSGRAPCLAVDAAMRADALLALQRAAAPGRTIELDTLLAPLRSQEGAGGNRCAAPGSRTGRPSHASGCRCLQAGRDRSGGSLGGRSCVQAGRRGGGLLHNYSRGPQRRLPSPPQHG